MGTVRRGLRRSIRVPLWLASWLAGWKAGWRRELSNDPHATKATRGNCGGAPSFCCGFGPVAVTPEGKLKRLDLILPPARKRSSWKVKGGGSETSRRPIKSAFFIVLVFVVHGRRRRGRKGERGGAGEGGREREGRGGGGPPTEMSGRVVRSWGVEKTHVDRVGTGGGGGSSINFGTVRDGVRFRLGSVLFVFSVRSDTVRFGAFWFCGWFFVARRRRGRENGVFVFASRIFPVILVHFYVSGLCFLRFVNALLGVVLALLCEHGR